MSADESEVQDVATNPSPDGASGRDASGRFADGNPGGPGNPHVRAVGRLRAELVSSVSAGDVREIVQALVAEARGGDVSAARELLTRLLGPPVSDDLVARLADLEARVEEVARTGSHG